MSDPSPETLTPERLSELERDVSEAGVFRITGRALRALLRAARERDELQATVDGYMRMKPLEKAAEARAEVSRLREYQRLQEIAVGELKQDVKALAKAARDYRAAQVALDEARPQFTTEQLRAVIQTSAALGVVLLARPGIAALGGKADEAL